MLKTRSIKDFNVILNEEDKIITKTTITTTTTVDTRISQAPSVFCFAKSTSLPEGGKKAPPGGGSAVGGGGECEERHIKPKTIAMYCWT